MTGRFPVHGTTRDVCSQGCGFLSSPQQTRQEGSFIDLKGLKQHGLLKEADVIADVCIILEGSQMFLGFISCDFMLVQGGNLKI